jgi:hypothetical protein
LLEMLVLLVAAAKMLAVKVDTPIHTWSGCIVCACYHSSCYFEEDFF